jgi:hypothetical protein
LRYNAEKGGGTIAAGMEVVMSRVAIGIAVAFMVALVVVAVSTAQEKPAADKENPKPEKEQTEKDSGLVIEQVCSGFPGSDERSKKTKQKVIIKGDKIYMQNLETPNVCIVRGDKKLIWEIDSSSKKYRERQFEYFAKMKADNKKRREKLAGIINNKIPSLKARLKNAEKNGFLANEEGKVSERPVAKTELTGEEKKINGFKCYHLKVYEDKKVVLDVWLTKQHKSPEGLMDFYKRLGCFCDEVIAEIKKIKDFPIALKAHLAFGALAIPVQCEISKIEEKKVDDKLFEMPKDVKPDPGRPVNATRRCLVCGKKFDAGGDSVVTYKLKNGKNLLLCSGRCRIKLGEAKKKYGGNEEKALSELIKDWKKTKDK